MLRAVRKRDVRVREGSVLGLGLAIAVEKVFLKERTRTRNMMFSPLNSSQEA